MKNITPPNRKKIGRPANHFKASDKTTINGLRRKPDGRWVIMATGQSFREPNEALAIARFRTRESRQAGTHSRFAVPIELEVDEENNIAVVSVPAPITGLSVYRNASGDREEITRLCRDGRSEL